MTDCARCLFCHSPIPAKGATGHPRLYCSYGCKNNVWLLARRWGMAALLRWAKENGAPLSKAPETPEGIVGRGK